MLHRRESLVDRWCSSTSNLNSRSVAAMTSISKGPQLLKQVIRGGTGSAVKCEDLTLLVAIHVDSGK